MACNYSKSETVYDVTVGGKSVSSTEELEKFDKTKDAVATSDKFPCGHTICHHCLRHYVDIKRSTWRCPVCEREFYSNGGFLASTKSIAPDPSSNYGDKDVVSVMSNFDGIVAKFCDINRNIDVLKRESVRAKSIGMCYNPVLCDNCDGDHGILQVIQEYNDLTVSPQRSPLSWPYMYYGRNRNCYDRVVTTYESRANSACVCVPCSYREIQQDPAAFYAITENNNLPDKDKTIDKLPLAEVAKLITKCPSPSKTLKGKNVIEIEHKIKVTNKFGEFDFNWATELIKRTVRLSETDFVQIVKKRIQDTGSLYHIQEKNAIDFDPSETVV